MLTSIIRRSYSDDYDTTNETCWSSIGDVDSMDMETGEDIFQECM